MPNTLQARLLSGLDKISPAVWNSLLGADREVLLSHEFLSAMEESGSVCPETGWQPCHLILEQGDEVVAALPLYLKGHSQGEYIFDQGWAEALSRAGLNYYPKLVSCVPFTPVGGARFLGAPIYHKDLLGAAEKTMTQLEASSLHFNFLTPDKFNSSEDRLLQRTHYQFHWHNQGYTSFDDFLSNLTSRHRKNIKRERKRAQTDLTIRRFSGAALTETLWDHFFTFYRDTGARKWGRPYLTREAFSLLGERLSDRLLLLLAFEPGSDVPLAGALNFIDETRLYGRYWGCSSYRDCLHFELSYYQAIDFAIERKLKVVEAGAQGEHKVERGYAPVKTYSAHLIAHTGLAQAVGDYLTRERQAVDAEINYFNGSTPFHKNAL